MIKWIIFDVDGTLIDTARANMLGLQDTMRELYGKKYDENQLYPLMGIPGDMALRKIGIEEEKVIYVWGYWENKVRGYAHYNYVFDGIKEMLKKLSEKYLLAIVTSKTHKQLNDEFAERELFDYFKIWICKEDTTKHKPSGEPLMKLLEKAEIKADEAVYIGDAMVDYKAAQAVGMKFGHCRFMKKVDNIECEVIFNNPNEITELFIS